MPEELILSPYESPSLYRVGAWSSLEHANEHALVLLAIGINCSVHPINGAFGLFTVASDAHDALEELTRYSEEQTHDLTVSPIPLKDYPVGISWLMAWSLSLTIIFFLQTQDPTLVERYSNSPSAVLTEGEWWRPFTALFLHADLLHLLGNILLGGVFCMIVSRTLGAWRGWLLILLGGTLGNFLSCLIQQGNPFESIGASTATFAALGIQVGVVLSTEHRGERSYRSKRLLVILTAGFAIFSLFGASGENTDVGGHLFGALSGLFLGVFAEKIHWGSTHKLCSFSPQRV